MIRINKPDTPPNVLTTKGKSKCRSHCIAYSRAAGSYRSGKRIFKFDANIYADDTVKQQLITVQHGKCFLCESQVRHISYGDVEHFRPKGGCCQNVDHDLEKPGYYWLAYEWSNLFLACQFCNQRFKKNLFPLIDPTKRAKSHKDDINQEESLFINPVAENPGDFISFMGGEPYAICGNAKGKATIENAGLHRTELFEMRLKHYLNLKGLYQALTTLQNLVKSKPSLLNQSNVKETIALLEQRLAASILDSAEYAAMARAAIASKFSII